MKTDYLHYDGILSQRGGLEIQSQFLRGNEQVYQCQVAFVLPGERVMMAFTYARTTPLTPADMTRWAEIKKNLRFRMRQEVRTN
nr:DcrB-related protein [Shigella flexneri]